MPPREVGVGEDTVADLLWHHNVTMMAANTGRLIVDLVGGRRPEIPLDGLTINRYAFEA